MPAQNRRIAAAVANTLIFLAAALLLATGCQGDAEDQSGIDPEASAVAAATATTNGATPTAEDVVESTQLPAPTEEAVPTDVPAATPTVAPTAEPTESPSPTATATATPVPSPTPTPTPEPTPTEAPRLEPAWLSYLNRFREMADLPPLDELTAYTLGSQLHSQYMVVNDEPIAHKQDPGNPLYDPAGDQAAKNGNIFATSQIEANYVWGINFWISAPFHLIAVINPDVREVGYGNYNEAIGGVNMAAVLDVRSDKGGSPEEVQYPIFFPKDGAETWIVRHSLFEWPDPFGSCPGYSRPSGPPIILQLGDGSLIPKVTSHVFAKGDQPLESCIYDETSYRNSNPYTQELGRTILGLQDAIVIMPRQPLPIDETYTVQVVANGETYRWSFRTKKGPDA